MQKLSKIRTISPALVNKLLIREPIGTYLIRTQTSNDDLLSSMKFVNRTNRQSYVILSVRVDPTRYPNSIMHYRLDATLKSLDEYKSRKNLPKLKRELNIKEDDLNWNVNSKEININFNCQQYEGENNAGIGAGYWRKSKEDLVKIVVKRFAKTSPYFDNEYHLLQNLSFFPIIKFYGQYSDRHYNYLVFEHGGRSLKTLPPLESSSFHFVNIAYQICEAMMYLEKKNIVHRDLSVSNVLIDDQGFIRLIDFGHALQRIPGKNNLCQAGVDCFQIRFLAPECLPKQTSNKSLYLSFTTKSDVWAYGILLVQLMLEKPSIPYPLLKTSSDVCAYIDIQRQIHPQPTNCSLDMYYILQQCWTYEPVHRLSFRDLREKLRIIMMIMA